MNQTEPTKVKVDGGCIMQPQSQLFIVSPPVVEVEYAPDEYERAFKEIWDNLSQKDVSQFVEKKDGLSYLPWSDCYNIIMGEYPDAEYHTYWWRGERLSGESTWQRTFKELGSYSVQVGITIKGIHKFISLPIWSGKPPKAVMEPDSMHINTAIQRCGVKAASRFGLALYLYQGEDLPVEPQPEPANMLPKPKPATLPKPKAEQPKEAMLSDNQRDSIEEQMFFNGKVLSDTVKEYLIKTRNTDDLLKLLKKNPPVITKVLAERILNQWKDEPE